MDGVAKTDVDLLDVIGRIYDAATDSSKWELVIDDLFRLFGATGCQLGHYDLRQRQLGFHAHKGFEHISAEGWRLVEELMADDPRMEVWQRLPGKPHSCRMSMDISLYHASRLYREVLDEAGVEYTLGVKLEDEEAGAFTGIAVMRNKTLSAFNQTDCDLMGLLIPHLRRSLAMYKRFAVLDLGQRTALEALDHIATGIVLLGEAGSVRFANRLARTMADDGDGFRIRDDRLLVDNPQTQRQIVAAADKAIQSARAGDILAGEPVTITKPSGGRDYACLVGTLWGNHLGVGASILDDPVAVLFVTDPERPQEAPADLLQRLYGLTPAEARILESLVAGNSLKATAAAQNIAYETARSHLTAVFDKTATSRQTDLVRLVLATPLWNAQPSYGDSILN
jgi:DNA-binding CsgD family transcriptional regulator